MSLLPGSRLGSYEIGAKLGTGGMGEVWRATDTRLGREVAIKVLPADVARDPERLARFEREAKLLASLNHPSIAHVYGFESAALGDASSARRGEAPSRSSATVPSGDASIGHFLVMELALGEDLAERLRRGPIPLDEAIAIAMQIAEALEEAHEKGIVHRDLKPANLKVSRDGKIKVLDFGLAKAYAGEGPPRSSGDLSQSPTLAHTGTHAGVILGTAAYMSPEQARGKAVDKRSDIWAFGVVLFEMLTGRRLFDGDTTTDILASVVKGPIPFEHLPPSTPESVRRLLARCLERDPRQRLRDMGEARIALARPDAMDETPRAAPAAPPRRGLARALPWVVGVIAIAVAARAPWRSSGSRGPQAADVVHLDVGFPADAEPVTGRQGGFAISPDGKAIAMVGFKNGLRRLYVRRLDTPDAADVSATSGAGVFSPDGASVAFVNSLTVLTRVSLADGQAISLASGGDFVSGVSLAWGPKDIFFTGDGALRAVPAGGGAARQLTTLDPSRNEVLHTDPLVLPGGRTVLFSRLTTVPGTERIEAVPAEGGPRSVVVEGATAPVWSPTGHLLFGRGGGVWAVPFDPVAVVTRGEALPVIPSGVVGAVRTGGLGFQVSANGTLVFAPVDFDTKRFVSVDRAGSERPLPVPPGSYGNPRVSPDGRSIAVEREGRLVESIDLARGTRSVIVPDAVGTAFPTWSSDGAKLLIRRYNVPFWAASDGSGKTGPVLYGDANTSTGSSGPDPGSFIAVRLRPETAGDLYLISISGAFPPKPLIATSAYEGSPHLSPDKHWLVYQSNASGQPEIYVRRYPELDRAWPVSEGGGVQCRWSATGREIYYRGGGHVMAVAFDGSGAEPALGKPTALFADVYDFGQGLSIPNYDVTREGRFLMLRRGAQGGTLRVVLNWTEELKRTLAKGGAR